MYKILDLRSGEYFPISYNMGNNIWVWNSKFKDKESAQALIRVITSPTNKLIPEYFEIIESIEMPNAHCEKYFLWNLHV